MHVLHKALVGGDLRACNQSRDTLIRYGTVLEYEYILLVIVNHW